MASTSSSWSYTNWNREQEQFATNLHQQSFELIHIPNPRKNSIDMALATDALNSMLHSPHITRIALISGDHDFRPLIITLRQLGKEIPLISDSRTTSQDLLVMVDAWKDIRQIADSVSRDKDKKENKIEGKIEKIQCNSGVPCPIQQLPRKDQSVIKQIKNQNVKTVSLNWIKKLTLICFLYRKIFLFVSKIFNMKQNKTHRKEQNKEEEKTKK